MLDEIEKAPRAGGAFSELPLHDLEAHERLLEIKRTSLWDIGCLCHAQLTLMLGSLQYSDDEKTWEYCRDTVGNFRAIARLVNDLRDTSRDAP
jgi:hypothetical protein